MVTLESAKKFLTNYELFIKFFSSQTLEKALKDFSLKSFQQTISIREYEKNYWLKQGYEIVAEGPRKFEEWKGEWHRTITEKGYDIIIPAKYQPDNEVFRNCLLIDFPYLENFKFNSYHLDNENAEIYINTVEGSVYTPIKALKENNKNLIIERMTEYWNYYYHGSKESIEKALKPLETGTCQYLFAILDTKQKGGEMNYGLQK